MDNINEEQIIEEQEELVTCAGCPRLSGDIIKDEEAKKIYIKFYCLADEITGHGREPLKVFTIPSLSIDGKLPKTSEYPTRCEAWQEKSKMTMRFNPPSEEEKENSEEDE